MSDLFGPDSALFTSLALLPLATRLGMCIVRADTPRAVALCAEGPSLPLQPLWVQENNEITPKPWPVSRCWQKVGVELRTAAKTRGRQARLRSAGKLAATSGEGGGMVYTSEYAREGRGRVSTVGLSCLSGVAEWA